VITNPFDQPPFAPEQATAWGQGFIFGLTGPLDSTDNAPDNLSDDVRDAFEQGQLAGQDAAANGLDAFPQCVDTEEQEHLPLGVELGFEASTAAIETVRGLLEGTKILGGIFSAGFMSLLDIALAAHQFTDPQDAINRISRDFFGTIESFGRPDCAFFLGVGVGMDSQGCELQLTSLFRTQQQAHDAAVAIGRTTWFVGQWHANQCGTMTVIDGATQ
jgi:hypothetical protein